jgi:mannitol/fructose-specific phosphotransferase system IIA component (Ntr-type)
VHRRGALFHVFERLGREVHRGLDTELLDILGEREAKELLEVDQLFTDAICVDVDGVRAWNLIHSVSRSMAAESGLDGLQLADTIVEELRVGLTLNIGGSILAHRQCPEIKRSMLAIGHLKSPLRADNDELLRGAGVANDVSDLFVLVSPTNKPDHHYRLLAEIIRRLEDGSWTQRQPSANPDG